MCRSLILIVATLLALSFGTLGQQNSEPQHKDDGSKTAPATAAADDYSGMYSFLREGEFVQVTVEDAGHVTGFVSRYGSADSDKGAFLDHFFKQGKLEGKKLTFTTEVVHGVSFDFKGTVGRGDGKAPGDEGYYILTGTLTEIGSEQNNKPSARSRQVVLKQFPQEALPSADKRD
jgi:hypothetical protein